MSEEKRNAAPNVSFDGAQFNAPTIIQTGDGSTANQGMGTFSPVDMKRILEFIGKYWLRLASPALSAVGVWGVWNLLVDWAVVALFWLTSSVAIYFVVDLLRRKRGRSSNESNDSFNLDALSASALALVVSALTHNHQTLVLNKGEIYFGSYRDEPFKTSDPQTLLNELVAAKLLADQSLYQVTKLARERFAALRQLDNRRVFAEASGDVIRLITRCAEISLDADIYIPSPTNAPPSPYLIRIKDSASLNSMTSLSTPDVFPYCFREGLILNRILFVNNSLQDADISTAIFIRTRLTERGKEIAALLNVDA
ncbi:MAG: hypothetical protein IKW13_04740 [Thermoguttaceae bacterium]|nr:hypothetical protein [Thermoguttaceae bacterium]